MLFCYFAYGFQPEEYLCFELEGKSMEVRKSFVSDTDHMRYAFSMNDISDIQIFNDKAMTYSLFSPYYHRDIVSIDKQSDYAKFENFVKKHPTFVKKDVFESLGRSVELVDINAVAASKKDYFNSLISKGKVILEEQVVQSEDFSVLNESSVNTVRCITFNTRHVVVAPYYFMKIGRVGSFVDNAGAGGIIVGIDKDTGKLVTDGYDELNRRFETHPDSGIVLKGIQLPDWDQLNAICKEMSAKMQNVKFIGWDLAHTDQGWVVIEGNGMSQLICPQIVFKRGIKKEVEDLMKDVDLIV